jgi:hypothetical protein
VDLEKIQAAVTTGYRGTPLTKREYFVIEEKLLDIFIRIEDVKKYITNHIDAKLSDSSIEKIIGTIYKNMDEDESRAEIEIEAYHNQ